MHRVPADGLRDQVGPQHWPRELPQEHSDDVDATRTQCLAHAYFLRAPLRRERREAEETEAGDKHGDTGGHCRHLPLAQIVAIHILEELVGEPAVDRPGLTELFPEPVDRGQRLRNVPAVELDADDVEVRVLVLNLLLRRDGETQAIDICRDRNLTGQPRAFRRMRRQRRHEITLVRRHGGQLLTPRRIDIDVASPTRAAAAADGEHTDIAVSQNFHERPARLCFDIVLFAIHVSNMDPRHEFLQSSTGLQKMRPMQMGSRSDR